MIRECRHCGKVGHQRTGRGLCRPCWDDKAVRKQYPPGRFSGDTRSASIGPDVVERPHTHVVSYVTQAGFGRHSASLPTAADAEAHAEGLLRDGLAIKAEVVEVLE